MHFQSLIAAVLPAIALAAPLPQDPSFDSEGSETSRSSIVGGTSSSAGEFPFIASLHAGGSHICGGTLINKNTILTAAHCSDSQLLGPISGLRARLGSASSTSGGTFVGISSVHIHPNYNSRTFDYDVAVWKLSTPVADSDTIGYATLPSANSDPVAGTMHTAAGWGATTQGGSSSKGLRKVNVPIVSRSSCQQSYTSESITSRMFCAGYSQGGRDACQGDSGGPLVNSSKGLIGVISWGNGCAQPNFPGVYVRISLLLPFIEQYS